MNQPYLKNPEINLENVVIETPRCRIEPFRIEWIDFQDLTEAFCEANENLYVSEHLPTIEQEQSFITGTITSRRSGKAFECFVFEKWSNHIIGAIGINSIDSNEPNLGLWIRKEYQWKWYGTEMYSHFISWLKNETNLTFVKHATNPENIGSIHLAEKFQWKLQEALTERWHLKYYITL